MGPTVEILTKSLKMGAQSCKWVVALPWDSQGGEGGWGRLKSPPWTPPQASSPSPLLGS